MRNADFGLRNGERITERESRITQKRIGQTNPSYRNIKAGLGKRLVLPHVAYGLSTRCMACRMSPVAADLRVGRAGTALTLSGRQGRRPLQPLMGLDLGVASGAPRNKLLGIIVSVLIFRLTSAKGVLYLI